MASQSYVTVRFTLPETQSLIQALREAKVELAHPGSGAKVPPNVVVRLIELENKLIVLHKKRLEALTSQLSSYHPERAILRIMDDFNCNLADAYEYYFTGRYADEEEGEKEG